jgi:PAS domain S-box-containing protein
MKIENEMNFRGKTKDELIKELQKLRQEYDSLKTLYEKDITGHKLVEERQAFILRSIPLLVYCSETTDIYAATWISENVKRVTGFDQDVFLKEEYFWSSRLHPDDRDRVLKTFNRLHESEQGAIEYRWQCANGEYRWFLDSFSSFKKTLEGKIEFIGIWLDITERKQVEEALRFIRGDYKNRIYLRPDETQMPEEEFASVRAIREQQAVHNVETGVLMEDGHVIWTNVNAAPVEFPDWKVVIITTDITERKKVEEELRIEKENFRHSLDDSPLGVRIATMEMVILFMLTRLFWISMDTIVLKNCKKHL